MTPDLPALLVATRNPGKLRELRELAAALARTPLTLDDVGVARHEAEERLEQFDTFEANAVAKAQYYCRASGLPTVADDSGLVVPALGGAPGVHSRRWGGFAGSEAEVAVANNAALLRRMREVEHRAARFVCAVAFADGVRTVTASGEVCGRIARAPRGGGGFGYDPLFEADELDGRTFGEVPPADKQRVSHRARALATLAGLLVATTSGR